MVEEWIEFDSHPWWWKMNSDLLALILFVGLLAANAFFVGSEFAAISVRRAQIEPLAEQGNVSAKITLRALEKVSLMLATAQLGITLCSLLILTVVEPSIHHLLEGPLSLTGLPPAWVDAVAFIVALVIVTYLHVVVGEMVPKNISFSIPTQAALILVPPLYAVTWLLRPLVVTLNFVANSILRLFKVTPLDEILSSFTLEQVENIVEHSTKEGVLLDASGTISKTFEFTEKKVRDVAIAQDSLVSFARDVTGREIEQAAAKYGFSRYLLVDQDSELIGYLHLKDVIDLDDAHADFPIETKRVRNLISLPEEMELEDALAAMRKVGAHLAKSFDATGQVNGVLFLEDILEVLVGEVQDATTKR
jgi:CBS domain containing-hemolysin-like protein